MGDGSEQQRGRVTKSWPGMQSWQDRSGSRPEKTGGLLSLYIAVVAAVAVYYMFS